MASGGFRPPRSNPYKNYSSNDDDFEENQRRVYSERETHVPTRLFSEMQVNNDETGSKTRQRLEQIESEIAREEDSATIIQNTPSAFTPGPSTREKIHKSEEKLQLIRARKSEISQLIETLKRSQTVDFCFLY